MSNHSQHTSRNVKGAVGDPAAPKQHLNCYESSLVRASSRSAKRPRGTPIWGQKPSSQPLTPAGTASGRCPRRRCDRLRAARVRRRPARAARPPSCAASTNAGCPKSALSRAEGEARPAAREDWSVWPGFFPRVWSRPTLPNTCGCRRASLATIPSATLPMVQPVPSSDPPAIRDPSRTPSGSPHSACWAPDSDGDLVRRLEQVLCQRCQARAERRLGAQRAPLSINLIDIY